MAVALQSNVPLAGHTTLKVGGTAELFTTVTTTDGLLEALAYANANHKSVVILGGGSNTLVLDTGVSGLVIKIAIEGITVTDEESGVLVTAGAGVLFDALVAMCVQEGLWGLENLSSIPGTVGATPVQNVGAYGVEVGDLISAVHVYDTQEKKFTTLTRSECQFGYRDSLFKHEVGRFIVTEVTYALSRVPQRRLSYKDLTLWFTDEPEPSLAAIRAAVTAIREQKFPDWHVVGTAGSFFKNPVVSHEQGMLLRSQYPELPLFPAAGQGMKVALGWILEHVLKVKGIRDGNVGTYAGQALVRVAVDGATASEVDAFAHTLGRVVYDRTRITIEREVTICGA